MSIEAWYGAIAAAACLLALALVRIAERLGIALGFVDLPRRGEVQQRPLPRTGGYGVLVAFWLAIGLSFVVAPASLERLAADNWRLLGLLIGTMAILPLAIADDRRRLSPIPQLAGHVVIASIPVFFGLRIDEVATPFGILEIPDLLAGPLVVLWIVGMINAINLIDNMDGVAAGISAIAAAVLFLRSAWFDQPSIAILPLALAGACLGFLPRNWHPSRVILGSSGALFLGYVLAATAAIGGAKIGTAFLVLAVPILDVAWVAYGRIAQRRSPLQGGDSAHLSQRLRFLGVGDAMIAVILYAVTASVGGAVLLSHSPLPTLSKLYLAAGIVGVVLALIVAVSRFAAARSSGADPASKD